MEGVSRIEIMSVAAGQNNNYHDSETFVSAGQQSGKSTTAHDFPGNGSFLCILHLPFK